MAIRGGAASLRVCPICPHHCQLDENQLGFCRARKNINNQIVPINFGRITSAALDPIEKKPLARFFPGNWILSIGSFGCNLKCPFCQNHGISQADENFPTQQITPENLRNLALDLQKKDRGNLGVAFTYNEPLIGFEFVLESAKLLRQSNLKTVLVTNGMICEKPLRELLPYVDAMNIDLKSFDQKFYDWCGAPSNALETIKKAIEISAENCHVELTTLIVTGANDSIELMDSEARWIASIDREIPLHISRFFPKFQVTDRPPTDLRRLYDLVRTAEKYLPNVFAGNV